MLGVIIGCHAWGSNGSKRLSALLPTFQMALHEAVVNEKAVCRYSNSGSRLNGPTCFLWVLSIIQSELPSKNRSQEEVLTHKAMEPTRPSLPKARTCSPQSGLKQNLARQRLPFLTHQTHLVPSSRKTIGAPLPKSSHKCCRTEVSHSYDRAVRGQSYQKTLMFGWSSQSAQWHREPSLMAHYGQDHVQCLPWTISSSSFRALASQEGIYVPMPLLMRCNTWSLEPMMAPQIVLHTGSGTLGWLFAGSAHSDRHLDILLLFIYNMQLWCWSTLELRCSMPSLFSLSITVSSSC